MRGIYVKKKPFLVGVLIFLIIEIFIGGADSIGFAVMRFIVCFLCYCIQKKLVSIILKNWSIKHGYWQ